MTMYVIDVILLVWIIILTYLAIAAFVLGLVALSIARRKNHKEVYYNANHKVDD